MVYPLLQSTCYDSSVSYITHGTELVRILPHNANGSWCQDIDLRLVVQVFPCDLRVPTPCCVIGFKNTSYGTQHSALVRYRGQVPSMFFFQGVSLIDFVLYLVFVDAFCKIWWTLGFCYKLDEVQIISLGQSHSNWMIERLKCVVSILFDIHVYIRQLLSISWNIFKTNVLYVFRNQSINQSITKVFSKKTLLIGN